MKIELNLRGNQSVRQMITDLVDRDRLPTAVVFIGPPGVGKRSFALGLAARDKCSSAKSPCGVCSSCRKVLSKLDPDCIIVDASKPSIGIGEVDQTLHSLEYKSSDRRWCFIFQAEKLTESAHNRLLKIIEEPPPRTTFVLTAPHEGLLSPTLRSRVSCFRWRRLTTDQMRELFPEASREDLMAADGRPGEFITLMNDAERLQKHTRAVASFDGTWFKTARDLEDEEAYRSQMKYEERLLRQELLTRIDGRPPLYSRLTLPELLQRLIRLSERHIPFSKHISSNVIYAHIHTI